MSGFSPRITRSRSKAIAAGQVLAKATISQKVATPPMVEVAVELKLEASEEPRSPESSIGPWCGSSTRSLDSGTIESWTLQVDLGYSEILSPMRSSSPRLPTITVRTPRKPGECQALVSKVTTLVQQKLVQGKFGPRVSGMYKGDLAALKPVPWSRVASLENELNNFLLSHDKIVTTLRILRDEGSHSPGVVVTKMFSTVHLDHLTLDKSFSMDAQMTASFALDLSLALEHCHSCSIAHLAVRPHSVLVNLATNECKLGDFSRSYILHQEHSEDQANTLLQGTLVYTAPEIMLKEAPTEKADVYSFGITLWEMLYRKIPYFGGRTDLDILANKVARLKLRPPIGKSKEKRLEDLCVECWSHKTDQRPCMTHVKNTLQDIEISARVNLRPVQRRHSSHVKLGCRNSNTKHAVLIGHSLEY